MASPPKPWERPGATPGATTPVATVASDAAAPPLPAMPTSLTTTSALNPATSAYSRPLGASPYGGYGGGYGTGYGSAYQSPYGGGMYSRFGGYGGYGGGMYGGGYGGYGGGMYGGGMYGGMPGMQGDPNDPNSLTNRFNTNTQATFQMLEGIVGAFGGFAQMLESTYMTTISSFFAMISVAEQFGNLREMLGSMLGINSLLRFVRTVIAKVTGRPPPADATALTPAAFARFEGRASGPEGGAPKPSRKPLLFFILAAFGVPYLLSKAMRSLANNEEEQRQRMEMQANQSIDPSRLDFCRVLYDFTPPAQPGGAQTQGVDLNVKKGDFVAVLSRTDPLGNPSEWWRCRTKDARVGYLPANYLEVLPGRNGAAAPVKAIKAAESDSSRTSSMTSSVTAPVMMPAAVKGEKPPALPSSKLGDITVDSFQKSQFYS